MFRDILGAALIATAWRGASSRRIVPTIMLNNGIAMPTFLWGSGGPTQENSTSTAPAVLDAIVAGFPGIDSANHYHNQDGVRKGIALSNVTRDNIWIQTKIEPCGHSIITPILQGKCFSDSLAAVDQNLEQLGVEQVDLTLLHSPPCVPNSTWADASCEWPDQPDAVYPQHCNCAAAAPCAMMQQQWKALEHALAQNKTRAIGVSNFCVPCLECIAQVSTVTPAVNQLQLHIGMPGEDPEGLVSATRQRGIAVQAYSPLGGDQHAALLGSAVVATIARRYNATPAQLCLRWVVQLGFALATSTVSCILCTVTFHTNRAHN